jgi:hypothetical protein
MPPWREIQTQKNTLVGQQKKKGSKRAASRQKMARTTEVTKKSLNSKTTKLTCLVHVLISSSPFSQMMMGLPSLATT